MTTFTPTFERTIGFDRVTKDYAAYCDGQVIGFFPRYLEAENALNEHIANLIRDTAIVTADMEAESAVAACTESPLLVEPAGRTYQCFVENCIHAPTHIVGDIPLCCTHYSEQASEPCDCGDDDDDYGDALADQAMGSYNGRTDCDPPIDPDPTPPPWEDCRNCGGAHSIQACPELWSALRAPVATPTAESFFILPDAECGDAREMLYLSIDGCVHEITAALIAGALGLTSPNPPNVDALLNEADDVLASISYTADYLQQFNIAYCLASGIITKQQLAERRAA